MEPMDRPAPDADAVPLAPPPEIRRLPATMEQPAPRAFPTTNLVMFLATVVTTFWAGAEYATGFFGLERPLDHVSYLAPHLLIRGYIFAVPFLAILLCHEFGHYILARRHRVDASLPYFIPAPPFLFGTLGAIIRMRSPIRTRNALLDIGAAGPLAGLAIAIPVTAYGLYHSFVGPVPPPTPDTWQEGQSLLYVLLKKIFVGEIPAGYDVFMHPMAFAGWAGFLVTLINLMPVGQLDGGHIAYALLGPRQDRVSAWVHAGLAALGAGIAAYYILPGLWHGGPTAAQVVRGIQNGLNWMFWAFVLLILRRLTGPRHPPTGPGRLSPLRVVVAVVSLVAFVALFMPIWMKHA